MSFRTRLFLAFTLAVLLPLGLLAWGVRREVERRLLREYEERVSGAARSLDAELARSRDGIAARLAALAEEVARDNRVRLALRGDPAARRDLLDWGPAAARLSGLAVLELHDSGGRVLSSGHFRNEYGRARPGLRRFLADEDRPRVVRARTPEGGVVALALMRPLTLGGEQLALVGGVPLDEETLGRLTPDRRPRLALVLPGSAPRLDEDETVAREISLPFLDLTAGASPGEARIAVVQSAATLAALRRRLDLWFAGALVGAAALGLALAAWLTARMTRPLRELAERTESIDLERLDQDFGSDRPDEIGTLARGLGAMTARLRAGAARLREAERRVAMGDLARQVNHDIKNGLVPIRNVLRHFDEVASAPATLASVYAERRATLESSVGYLETLARNYARLSPAAGREACDVNAVVREVVHAVPPSRAGVRTGRLAELPLVPGDRIAIRRIVENLVGNAVDSVAATGGSVEVSTETARRDNGTPLVRITVADEGTGMSRAELDRAFDDFYTTKKGGTGLGLSIVRRLVLDLGGTLRVDTGPGEGTRVTVELPAGGAG